MNIYLHNLDERIFFLRMIAPTMRYARYAYPYAYKTLLIALLPGSAGAAAAEYAFIFDFKGVDLYRLCIFLPCFPRIVSLGSFHTPSLLWFSFLLSRWMSKVLKLGIFFHFFVIVVTLNPLYFRGTPLV